MVFQAIMLLPGQTVERRWARFDVDVPVQMVTQDPTNAVEIHGRGSAMNCGGMAVYGRGELAIGTQVAAEFSPPHSAQRVRVRCFIRNRHLQTYGLEFITENDSDYENVGLIEAALEKMTIGPLPRS